jgi:hypothetical protein
MRLGNKEIGVRRGSLGFECALSLFLIFDLVRILRMIFLVG